MLVFWPLGMCNEGMDGKLAVAFAELLAELQQASRKGTSAKLCLPCSNLAKNGVGPQSIKNVDVIT